MQQFFAEINGFFTCNGHFMKQSLQNKAILLNTMRLLPMQLSFLCLIGHCWLACLERQEVFTSLVQISHYYFHHLHILLHYKYNTTTSTIYTDYYITNTTLIFFQTNRIKQWHTYGWEMIIDPWKNTSEDGYV